MKALTNNWRLQYLFCFFYCCSVIANNSTALKHIDTNRKSQLTNSTNTQNPPILMPIEVLGEVGTIETRELNLSEALVKNTKRLWLQINNLSYQNKGSLRINNGDWYDLNHQSVQMHFQEKARGGMVHGGYNTIRFSVPVTNLTSGNNTLEFRFNKSDGISIGYRIVKLNLLDRFGNTLLSDEAFEHDNPDNWEAPYRDAQSIAEGKDLWYNAELWNHYLPEGEKGFWYGIKLPERRKIRAKCTDCHTQDGRDLELFSYSNLSIIERTKFHGLSEEEGKKIASYIRSLTNEHDNVERSGRPWNPPYQPGPAVADLEIHNWHAGAGLDAVLEQDQDILPYMFPNGVNQETVYEYFDADKVQDRTVLPITQQLPDWKHWLPMIHPMDAYGEMWDAEWINKLPKRLYKEARDFLENNDVSQITDAWPLVGYITRMSWSYRAFNQVNGSGHWRSRNSATYRSIINGVGKEYAKTSLARLKAVKTFEVMHEFDLQNFSKKVYAAEDNVPERQWPGRIYHVFEVAPHFTSCETNVGCKNFIGQPRSTGFFESTNWYELQSVIGGGHGISGANAPMDWKYHHNFIRRTGEVSGIHEPLRFFRSIANMYQVRNWKGAGAPSKNGFQIRHQSPHWFLGTSRGLGNERELKRGYLLKSLDNIEPGMTEWVTNGLLNMFLKEMEKPRNHISNFRKSGAGGEGNLDVEQATPYTNSRAGFNYSYHFHQMIPVFAKLGADCELLNRFTDWSQSAWPSWDWQPLKQRSISKLKLKVSGATDNPSDITAVLTNPGSNPKITWYVNEVEITAAADNQVLSNDYFAPGDKISCSVTASVECLSPVKESTLESALVLPTTKLFVSLNDYKITDSEKVDTEEGDILTIHKEIDLKPMIWLDAMQIKNEGSYNEGDLVDIWVDKSGNGYDALQTNDDLKPVYRADHRGLPSIWFGHNDNVNRLTLATADNTEFLNNEWTIFVIGREYAHANDQFILGNRPSNNAGFGIGFKTKPGSRPMYTVEATNQSLNYQKASPTQSFIISALKNTDHISSGMNNNVKQYIYDPDAIQTATPLFLGAYPGSFNRADDKFHKGPIYEVLVFDRSLSNTEMAYVEGYLAHKWKLNDIGLKSHHKFKNNSPTYSEMLTPQGKVAKDLGSGYQQEISKSDFGLYEIENKGSTFTFELIGNIDNDEPLTDIIIYPNPTGNYFEIANVQADSVILFNSIGQKIGTLLPENGVYEIPFHLALGVYQLIITSGDLRYIAKIIKE